MRRNICFIAIILVNFALFSTIYASEKHLNIREAVFKEVKRQCNNFTNAMHNPKMLAGALLEKYDPAKIPPNPEAWLKKRLEIYLKARPDLPNYEFYYGKGLWPVLKRDTKIKFKVLTSLKIREHISLEKVPKNCKYLQMVETDFGHNKHQYIARHETQDQAILIFASYNKRSNMVHIEDIYIDGSIKKLLQKIVAHRANSMGLTKLMALLEYQN